MVLEFCVTHPLFNTSLRMTTRVVETCSRRGFTTLIIWDALTWIRVFVVFIFVRNTRQFYTQNFLSILVSDYKRHNILFNSGISWKCVGTNPPTSWFPTFSLSFRLYFSTCHMSHHSFNAFNSLSYMPYSGYGYMFLVVFRSINGAIASIEQPWSCSFYTDTVLCAT
jgi:hypothetical protein